MINTPSCVARLPANPRRRCRTSSGSEGDWPISKRSWTAVETLLTFWPPGPEARTKVNLSSESGMIMGKGYLQDSPEGRGPAVGRLSCDEQVEQDWAGLRLSKVQRRL